MKLTIRQALESRDAFTRLVAQSFPVKLSYKLGRVLTGLERELQRYERHRVELIKKHGEQVDGTDKWQILPASEKFEAFTKEFEELVSIEFKVWGDPITLDELDGLGECEITPADIAALDWLIQEPAEQSNV